MEAVLETPYPALFVLGDCEARESCERPESLTYEPVGIGSLLRATFTSPAGVRRTLRLVVGSEGPIEDPLRGTLSARLR